MGVEMLMEARMEVSSMTTFSKILLTVDVTAFELAHNKLQYASAAWRSIILMLPMLWIGLTCIVHGEKAATMIKIRLMLLGVIGVGRRRGLALVSRNGLRPIEDAAIRDFRSYLR